MTINNFDQIHAILSLGLMTGMTESLGNKVAPSDNVNHSLYELKKNQVIHVEEFNKNSLQIMEEYVEKYASKFQFKE